MKPTRSSRTLGTDQRRHRRRHAVLAGAVLGATLLAACVAPYGHLTPLGQYGFDAQNTGSNPAETTLDQSNVSGLVAKFDTDLSALDTLVHPGDPVFAPDGNIIVTSDNEVMSVRTDGSVAWNVTIPDAHPEIAGPHIISAYGDSDYNTVDVSVDNKEQGPAPNYVGGYIAKFAAADGSPVSTVNTFRPAAPLGYSGTGLVRTGEVLDHADYGPGRTITVDVAGSGRRIIRNAVGTPAKPAVNGDTVAIAVGGSLYQWSTTCAVSVCDETTAAVTAVEGATRPVIVGTTVYTASTDRHLYAIGPDGAVLWTGGIGQVPAPVSASVASGRVFVGNVTGIIWEFPLDGCGASTCPAIHMNSVVDQIWVAPTLANGLAYWLVNGGLRIIRTDCAGPVNCSPKKSITLSGPMGGSLHQVLVKDGRVYVLTGDGHLRAYGL